MLHTGNINSLSKLLIISESDIEKAAALQGFFSFVYTLKQMENLWT